jgi:hypothetical protein
MRSSIVVVLTGLVLAIAGCNTTTNPEPPDAARPDAGPRDAFVSGDASPDAGPRDGGSDSGSDAGDVDAFVADSGPLPDGGPDDVGIDAWAPDAFSCTDPTSSCYRCPPSTDLEFLNHCTTPGVTCEPFPVTTARLPLLNADGSLPPLP